MKISKIHQAFSEELNKPDALTNPEKYLGPNWEDVLNFWIYFDTLSDLEKREIADRYLVLDSAARDSAFDAASRAAVEVVGRKFRNAACDTVWDTTGCFVFGDVTLELIGSHKLIEQGNPLTFLPLIIKKTTPLKKFLNLIKRIFQL